MKNPRNIMRQTPMGTLTMRISVRAAESSRRIPAVNGVRERNGYDEWRFVEIANDIRDIKNELIATIEGM